MDNLPIPPDESLEPHDLGAEQAILGAIMLEPKTAMTEAVDKLRGDEFYSSAHRNIYGAMAELEREGVGIDLVTLKAKLSEKGWLDKVGGILQLTRLANHVPTAANIGHYLDIVIDKHMNRLLRRHADEFHDLSRSESQSQDLLDAAQATLSSIADRKPAKKPMRKMSAVALDCFEELEHRYNSKDGTGITGIPSGFDDVDKLTSGFQKADLVVVGARPSVGKTVFLENISRHAAAYLFANQIDDAVAVFSLEMGEKQLVNRSLSAEANVDGHALRTGHLLEHDWNKLSDALGKMDTYNIWIDDTPAISPWEILAKCRKLKQERGLAMILIDYLQLMSGRRRSGSNRQEEISEISRMLKLIAKELEVPVIALSQLSRGVEQRQDKKPVMSDLRESGSLEQDADIVAFLHREDYYDKETEKKNLIEVIVAKQRNGPIGTAELIFLKQYSKFVSKEKENGYSPPPDISDGFKKPDMHRKGA